VPLVVVGARPREHERFFVGIGRYEEGPVILDQDVAAAETAC
jgi:hypothetical protein